MQLSPDTLPAVLIGGPPHSGKSVLTYSLSQALRARQVEHYVLRACPDGEGDWANEAQTGLVRQIRVKGAWTSQWVSSILRDISRRHLPLLVDVGGKPTAEQEQLFDVCTHAILLTPHETARLEWLALAARHRLPVIADLHSQLDGEGFVSTTFPILQGRVTGLERGTTAHGPAFEALVTQLANLLARDRTTLRQQHLAMAPVELAVDLERVAHALGIAPPGQHFLWQPTHLPALLDYLPAAKPLAIYGRAPVWVYAALAGLAAPAPLVSFDVRLGWVTPPTVHWGAVSTSSPVRVTLQSEDDHVRYDCQLPTAYIDRDELDTLVAPEPSPHHGVVLNGKLPQWLWTALTPALASRTPWVAVYWPQGDQQAIVVASRDPQHPIGTLVPSQASR